MSAITITALVFIAIAIVFGLAAIRRRDWYMLAQIVSGTTAVELGYRGIATHETGFTIMAVVVAVGQSAIHLIVVRRIHSANHDPATSENVGGNTD
jgi:hypothetical protein